MRQACNQSWTAHSQHIRFRIVPAHPALPKPAEFALCALRSLSLSRSLYAKKIKNANANEK